jgi:N-ATPase, AtpR subunit
MSLGLAVTAGCLGGAAYSWHLWHDARSLVLTGRRSLRWSVLLRTTGLGIVLAIVGRAGEVDLFAGAAGLLLTRSALVWHVRGVPSA